jgi:hypothetical protein
MIALTQNCLGDGEQAGRRGFERNVASSEALLLELTAPMLEWQNRPEVTAQRVQLWGGGLFTLGRGGEIERTAIVSCGHSIVIQPELREQRYPQPVSDVVVVSRR